MVQGTPRPGREFASDTLSGIVQRINAVGLCFIREESSNRPFVFTFDKVRDYRGESAAAIGLNVGDRIRFAVRGDQVEFVELSRQSQPRS